MKILPRTTQAQIPAEEVQLGAEIAELAATQAVNQIDLQAREACAMQQGAADGSDAVDGTVPGRGLRARAKRFVLSQASTRLRPGRARLGGSPQAAARPSVPTVYTQASAPAPAPAHSQASPATAVFAEHGRLCRALYRDLLAAHATLMPKRGYAQKALWPMARLRLADALQGLQAYDARAVSRRADQFMFMAEARTLHGLLQGRLEAAQTAFVSSAVLAELEHDVALTLDRFERAFLNLAD